TLLYGGVAGTFLERRRIRVTRAIGAKRREQTGCEGRTRARQGAKQGRIGMCGEGVFDLRVDATYLFIKRPQQSDQSVDVQQGWFDDGPIARERSGGTDASQALLDHVRPT